MGYQTVVVIQNDSWHAAEENPRGFVDAIRDGMNSHGPGDEGDLRVHVPANEDGTGYNRLVGKVFESRHADELQLIAVGGNMATTILRSHIGAHGHFNGEGQEKILRALAEKLGFNVSRKAKVKQPQ